MKEPCVFAAHLPEAGYDIRTIQELPGYKDVSTTMIYTLVTKKVGRGIQSPADLLERENDCQFDPGGIG